MEKFSLMKNIPVRIAASVLVAVIGVVGACLFFAGKYAAGTPLVFVPLAYLILLVFLRDKDSYGAKAVYSVMLAIFYVYAILITYMLVWAILQSLKADREFSQDLISLPKDWLFSNYATAIKTVEYQDVYFFGLFVNSIWYSVGLTFLTVFMTLLTGYVFAKYNFRGKEIAFSFILLTLSIPIVGSLPSEYKIIRTLGLNDSFLYLITGLGGFGSNFLISYAFFKGIDKAYMEAAQMDGAGHWRVFLRIMLPLASGLFISLFILGFISKWNEYEKPMLFLDRMPTLAVGLYYYRNEHAGHPAEYLAGVILSMIPVLVLVSAFGNRLMKSMTVGGVKG